MSSPLPTRTPASPSAINIRAATSFVPNVTPIYDLTDDDFKADDNEDPLQVTRSDPYQAYNVWRLEIAERVNAYNLTTVESRDQNAIELYGMRIASTVTAHEICDPNVALISGQLMLQRAVYIRNTYKFRLSWEYCLLDPDGPGDGQRLHARAGQCADPHHRDRRGRKRLSAGDGGRISARRGDGDALCDAAGVEQPDQSESLRQIRSIPPIIFEPPSALVGVDRASVDRRVRRFRRRRRPELGRRLRLAVARRLVLSPRSERSFRRRGRAC